MKTELRLEKNKENRGLSRVLRRKIFLAQIFIFLATWSVTFFTSRNLRALQGIPSECSPLFSHELPIIIDGFIRYGLWGAFSASFIYSFIRGFHSFKESLLEYIVALTIFSSYAITLELIFPSTTSGYVNWVVVDIVFFSVAIPVGNFFGHIFSAGFVFFFENGDE